MPSGSQHQEKKRHCENVANTSTIWLVTSLHKADAIFGELLHRPHHRIYGLHNFLNKSTTNTRKHRTTQCNAMQCNESSMHQCGELATNKVDAAIRTSRYLKVNCCFYRSNLKVNYYFYIALKLIAN
jgi:hypothetical protein